jgi:SAM-dependent methyltransferase
MTSPAPPSPLATPRPWDLVSSDYAAELAPFFTRFAEDALARIALAPGARFLDVAAGPGTLAFVAARAGARVSTIDFSPAMTAQLRARAAREQVTVDARVGDGQALPFPDAAFDAAGSMFGLMFFPDRARGFRELARVLVPDGRAVVTSWQPSERAPAFQALLGAIREEMPGLPFGGAEAPLGAPATCIAEMSAGGFADVEVVERTHTLRFPSLDELWAWGARTTAPVVLLRERLGAGWPRFAEGVAARLRAKLGAGPQELPMPAYLTFGRRA